VPIRIEMGPKDVAQNQVIVVRRDTGEKMAVPQEGLLTAVESLLERMQKDLYARALRNRDANTFTCDEYKALIERLESPGGFFWVHWCGQAACEEKFQQDAKATIRLQPIEGGQAPGACIVCGAPSAQRVLVAKSY